jgi:hypothetical protein
MLKLRPLYSQGNIILNGGQNEMDSETVKIKTHEGLRELEYQLFSLQPVDQLT